jgi:hypothetical protein
MNVCTQESMSLHAQLLEQALSQAVVTDTQPQTTWTLRATQYAQLCASTPALTLCATALLAVCLLLVIRPPFVLIFEQDARRPWRGSTRVSWFALAVAALVTALLAATLPVIATYAA